MKKIAICDDEPAVRKQMEAYFKELESVFASLILKAERHSWNRMFFMM